ncbi:MAG TPA: SMI1/KNR4 family protein [Kofleriaceae bacterium]
MDPEALIRSTQARLLAVADGPPLVEDPWPARAAARLARTKAFVGYPESEVAAAERALGVQFPAMFRTYLLRIGRTPGDLFVGSDLASLDPTSSNSISRFRSEAIALMGDAAHGLPSRAVIFLFHQGYTFLFFDADGGSDAPVFQFVEGEAQPKQIAASFAELVENELALHESNRRLL